MHDHDPLTIDCLISISMVSSCPLTDSVDIASSNLSLLCDDTFGEDMFSNDAGHKLIKEYEFDVGSQDLDDLSSKGIALTPTRTISQLSHVVQGPLSNLSPLDLHLRPKISTHTLQYLNNLVIICDVGVVDDYASCCYRPT